MNAPDIRYRVQMRNHPLRSRIRMWLANVWDAITEPPPTQYADWSIVRRGEPGFDDAPYGMDDVKGPSFKMGSSGEFIRVPDSET